MDVTVGTFNLNNLFTRWNFRGSAPAGATLTEIIDLAPGSEIQPRKYRGKLVTGKKQAEKDELRDRIIRLGADVLAVQEVENIEALKSFNRDELGGMYPHTVLIEGNDPRLIDVGVLSTLPIGQVVTHQTEPDPEVPGARLFGRDLLRVDVLTPSRSRKLFTLFNTHLKSNYVNYQEADKEAAAEANNQRRRRQADGVARIIESETRPNSRYLLVGDMNDDPDSAALAPLANGRLGLVDALLGVQETRPSKTEADGPQPGPRWTSRHRPSGELPQHRLFDQIWASPALAPRASNPMIDRRTKHSGDGSDHDPAVVTLTL